MANTKFSEFTPGNLAPGLEIVGDGGSSNFRFAVGVPNGVPYIDSSGVIQPTSGQLVQSVAGKTGAVTLTPSDIPGVAPLNSPVFTGTPSGPTPATADNSTKFSTTAYVQAQGYITAASAPVTSVAGRTGDVVLTKSDVGLANVENTALSTWPGSTAITSVGTITTGTWNGTVISTTKGGFGQDVSTGLTDGNIAVVSGGAITIGPLSSGSIPATGVTSGSYPNTGEIPTFIVGTDGRLTAAGTTTVGSALTALNATNLSTGTVAEARGGTGMNSSTIGTGLVTRTGANTYIARTLSNGTGTTVTNGAGTAGNPSVNVTYGTGSSTATQGNDTRLNPAPSGAGKMLYDTSTAYAAITAGTTSQVLIGGTTPAFGNVPSAALTSIPAGNLTGTVAEANGGHGSNISAIGTGLVTRTAANTYIARSLTAPASGFSITNPDGVSGSPTFALNNDLAAVEGLSGTGLVVRTATNTWTNRSVQGSGINVTNGDGIFGNIILSPGSDIQTFTSNGIWTCPTAGNFVRLIIYGGGAGGGAGRRGAASSWGGGGGGGGAFLDVTVLKSAVANSSGTVGVTVGTGGAGGAAVTVDNTNGNDGSNGNPSYFGLFGAGSINFFADGGVKGAGGTNSTGAAGTGGVLGVFPGGSGAAGSSSGGSSVSLISGFGAPGGGGGAGYDGSAHIGGNGGAAAIFGNNTSAGGGPGVAGTAGTQSLGNGSADLHLAGTGGGGGGSNTGAAPAGAGGAGGLYGAGGGGGGANLNGANSGAGGNGANGIVVVITY